MILEITTWLNSSAQWWQPFLVDGVLVVIGGAAIGIGISMRRIALKVRDGSLLVDLMHPVWIPEQGTMKNEAKSKVKDLESQVGTLQKEKTDLEDKVKQLEDWKKRVIEVVTPEVMDKIEPRIEARPNSSVAPSSSQSAPTVETPNQETHKLGRFKFTLKRKKEDKKDDGNHDAKEGAYEWEDDVKDKSKTEEPKASEADQTQQADEAKSERSEKVREAVKNSDRRYWQDHEQEESATSPAA